MELQLHPIIQAPTPTHTIQEPQEPQELEVFPESTLTGNLTTTLGHSHWSATIKTATKFSDITPAMMLTTALLFCKNTGIAWEQSKNTKYD